MTMKISCLALVGFVAWMLGGGCDGRTIIGGSQMGIGGAIAVGVGGATGISGAGGGTANTCPVAGGAATPTTIADMRAALSRDWILCSPLGLTHLRQVGLRITTADRYALLGRDAAGNLTAMSGADFEGSLEYLQLGNRVVVNFVSDIGFTIISAPVITNSPAVLIINNNGVFEYRYVSADEPATGGGGASGSGGVTGGGGANGEPLGMGTCPASGVAATPTTVDGLRAALSRQWILCSPLGLTQQPQAGIEVSAAGRYALLGRDSSGAVTPMHGVDFEGNVTYLTPNQRGAIQVNFLSDLGGSIGVFVVITQNPTMLIIPGGSDVYRYILPDGS